MRLWNRWYASLRSSRQHKRQGDSVHDNMLVEHHGCYQEQKRVEVVLAAASQLYAPSNTAVGSAPSP